MNNVNTIMTDLNTLNTQLNTLNSVVNSSNSNQTKTKPIMNTIMGNIIPKILTLSGPTLKFYMEEWDKFVIFPHVWS